MHAWPADWPPRHVCGARCIRLPCLCSTELLSACDCGATNGMCWICPQCFEPIGLAGAAAVVVLNHLHRVLPGAPVRG